MMGGIIEERLSKNGFISTCVFLANFDESLKPFC